MDQIVFHEPSGDVVPSLRGPELENGEKESPLGCGVGTFLRDERQKKGLDHSQISEITRIRPHFLEAIENEDWDHLPSSVFVISFIRSYARALGLEEGEIVSRYQNETPPKTISPKTAQEPAGSKKIRSVVLIVLLIIVGVGYYYWRNLLPGEENAKHPKFEGAVSEQIADSEPVQEVIAGSESPFSNGREEAGAGPILPAGGQRS